jgi:hypothetical protein
MNVTLFVSGSKQIGHIGSRDAGWASQPGHASQSLPPQLHDLVALRPHSLHPQNGLWAFQSADWHSLLQYLTVPQPEHVFPACLPQTPHAPIKKVAN